jgi:hypothetical protein
MKTNYFKIVLLAIITGLLFSTCNKDDTQHDDDGPDLIGTVKAGYSEQFNDLYHYGKFVETPLWDEYWTYKDSVITYVYVPYEQVVNHAKALLIVRISEKATDYCIRIENLSVDVSEIPQEKIIVGLYRATKNNSILVGGYRDLNNNFVQLKEIPLVSAGTKGPSDDNCCECLCYEGDVECYCTHIADGECLGVVYVIGYGSNYSNEDFFGNYGASGGSNGNNSNGNSNTGDGSGGGVYQPPPTVTLSIKKKTITIMDKYDLEIILSYSANISNVTFEIGNTNDFESTHFILQNGMSTLCNERAKKAGKWTIRAVVSIIAGLNIHVIKSNIIDVTVQYPSVSTIRANEIVSTKMASVWQETKNAASSSGRMEKGFAIYVNTTTMSYECGTTVNGPTASSCDVTGSVSVNSAESSQSSPIAGAKYLVALFHTHTPLTYCPNTKARPTGPSSTDIQTANTRNTPGILYDYTGEHIPNYYVGIKGKHDINAASKLYTFGPNRRNTPN